MTSTDVSPVTIGHTQVPQPKEEEEEEEEVSAQGNSSKPALVVPSFASSPTIASEELPTLVRPYIYHSNIPPAQPSTNQNACILRSRGKTGGDRGGIPV